MKPKEILCAILFVVVGLSITIATSLIHYPYLRRKFEIAPKNEPYDSQRLIKERVVDNPFTHSGYGACGRCNRTWDITDNHTTYYASDSGCFPLCADCWKKLTPEERLPYYQRLYIGWFPIHILIPILAIGNSIKPSGHK